MGLQALSEALKTGSKWVSSPHYQYQDIAIYRRFCDLVGFFHPEKKLMENVISGISSKNSPLVSGHLRSAEGRKKLDLKMC